MTTPVSQQIVRDTFVRANSGTLGANWTALSDALNTATIGITSNSAQVQTTGGNAASFWSANTFTGNQYAQCVINVPISGTDTHGGGPCVRVSVGNFYRFFVNFSNVPAMQLQKLVGGMFTTIGAAGSFTAVNGSLARIEAVGSQITCYVDGVQVIQVTDTDLTTGAPGICSFINSGIRIINLTAFEGGNIIWTRKGTAIPVNGAGSAEPSVIYEANPKILTANADGKIWKMWFMDGWTSTTIWYAESNDGFSWTMYGSNPVISESGKNPGHGVVFKNGSTYYGYYNDDTTSAAALLNRWISSDGITWAKTGVALPAGTTGQWDSGGVFNPCVFIQNGTWYMVYNGRNGTPYSLGIATSPDGITWTKYASNPVYSTGGTAAEGKTIVIDGGQYYLWGFQSPTGNLPTDLAMYSTPDLHTWTPNAKNPIYERVLANEGANLANGQIGDPYLVELNGTTYMYYDATNAQASGHFVINVATAPYTLLQLVGMITGQNIIYGNVGVAGATVNYSGPSSGSVTADASGNYVIPVQSNGTYTVTPSSASGTFTPTSQPAVVSSADVAANFTGTPPALAYSVPDCRVAPFGPNTSRNVQGTLIYDVQTSSNPAVPSTDSRVPGAPVDSRISPNIPQNSRTPGLYGPGE